MSWITSSIFAGTGGGRCAKVVILGPYDLDFTALEEHDHEGIILDMMDAFAHPFHYIYDLGMFATMHQS